MRVFPHVDLLRALAALLVVVYHLDALGSLALRGDVFWTLPFRYGWVGVDLFLVISGFVIMLSAAQAHDRTPKDFKWPFMQRRLRRLLPLSWLILAALPKRIEFGECLGALTAMWILGDEGDREEEEVGEPVETTRPPGIWCLMGIWWPLLW